MALKKQEKVQRDSSGRFRGAGAYQTTGPSPKTRFTPLSEAACSLREALADADCLLRNFPISDDGVPTVIIRASPGSGKSTSQRRLMADRVRAGDDAIIAYHVPTLTLADDAAHEALALGIDAQAIRGRSAVRSDGQGTMCAKADMVDKASRLGISVRDNFCERKEDGGTVRRCPHFENCAYLDQFKSDTSHRFLATTYMGLPDPSGTTFTQRVVDETFWREFLRIHDVEAASFMAPRAFLSTRRASDHADLLAAARDVFAALITGQSPLALPFTAEDYSQFEKLEWEAKAPSADLAPDQDSKRQRQALTKAEKGYRKVASFSAIWSVLASAKANGATVCERIRLYEADGKHMIRVMTKRPLLHSEPMLVLDADADSEIIAALGCNIMGQHDLVLKPNAIVRQLHDNRMCTTSLIQSRHLRQKWREIIAKEVLIDRRGAGTGVLVGASRKVVRAFFEDAGYEFDTMSDDEVSRFMLDTALHGAHWLWLGSRALGSNRYKNCLSVIVIGREEIPTQALEDLGAALWGDTPDEALDLIKHDEKNNKWMPELEVPYLMSNASSMGVKVPCHPDPRIRRIQLQTRELATRQLIERLRLARSDCPKRVLLGCNIPIPHVPVDELLSWDELCLERVEAAITVGLVEIGSVRLTHQGLHDAAPGVFRSLEAVKGHLKRGEQAATRFAYYKTLCSNAGRIKTLTSLDIGAA